MSLCQMRLLAQATELGGTEDEAHPDPKQDGGHDGGHASPVKKATSPPRQPSPEWTSGRPASPGFPSPKSFVSESFSSEKAPTSERSLERFRARSLARACEYLPEGWTVAVSPGERRPFFVHTASGAAQWHHPCAEPEPEQADAAAGSHGGPQQDCVQEAIGLEKAVPGLATASTGTRARRWSVLAALVALAAVAVFGGSGTRFPAWGGAQPGASPGTSAGDAAAAGAAATAREAAEATWRSFFASESVLLSGEWVQVAGAFSLFLGDDGRLSALEGLPWEDDAALLWRSPHPASNPLAALARAVTGIVTGTAGRRAPPAPRRSGRYFASVNRQAPKGDKAEGGKAERGKAVGGALVVSVLRRPRFAFMEPACVWRAVVDPVVDPVIDPVIDPVVDPAQLRTGGAASPLGAPLQAGTLPPLLAGWMLNGAYRGAPLPVLAAATGAEAAHGCTGFTGDARISSGGSLVLGLADAPSRARARLRLLTGAATDGSAELALPGGAPGVRANASPVKGAQYL